MASLTKVVTGPETRLSYAHVWEPQSINGSDPKYSVSLIIPKTDTKTVDAIKQAIKAAYAEGLNKLKGNGKTAPALSAIKQPLRDGDAERPDDEAYAGCYFINASSKTQPQIVDKQVQPILDQNEVYSGCYGRVSVNFYAFNTNDRVSGCSIYLKDSNFYGWTSYDYGHPLVQFTNCTFTQGTGAGEDYAYCRPIANTEFLGCEFTDGATVNFEIDVKALNVTANPSAQIIFENCTINGQPLTAELAVQEGLFEDITAVSEIPAYVVIR